MEGGGASGVPGSALGPDWMQRLEARGAASRRVRLLYKTELRRLRTSSETGSEASTAQTAEPASEPPPPPPADGMATHWTTGMT